MKRRTWIRWLGLLLVLGWPAALALPVAADVPPCGRPPVIAGCEVFPADNIWNVRVDGLPPSSRSAAYVASIGAGNTVHPDFGSGLWDGGPIGIPFCVVSGSQPKVNVSFYYPDESDPGLYPIPPNAPIEGGSQADGDRHVLVLDRDNQRLYELYDAHPQDDGSWSAGSGAIYDLRSNALRPAGWTSADAAGLPILPGLVRYDEIAAGEIRHAIRVTAPHTQRSYVWPARHFASSSTDPTLPPMGQRFRLRSDFDLSGYSPEVQIILTAMKRYGLILADNGAPWYIGGVPDERWDNDTLVSELRTVQGTDFEAVDCSSLMVHPDSAQAACQPASIQAQVPLRTGWNLVSLPVAPQSTEPSALLAGIAGQVQMVYGYDAAMRGSPWRLYTANSPAYANDLTRVDERMGLWIETTGPVTLTVTGAVPGGATIPLYAGWNLVGYPCATARPIAEALASIAGHYAAVYAYDAGQPGDRWQMMDPSAPSSTWTLTMMAPGRGYWIEVQQPCTWQAPGP